ncbi:MAG: magnesium transporter [Candidatus Aenigmatarchaeota archaeon]
MQLLYVFTDKALRQSFVALLISVLAAVFAGLLLGKFSETLLMLPGLFILVPPALGMRGNIFSALGSRLGSALHLGTIDKFTLGNRVVKNNIYATFTTTIALSVFLGFLADILTKILGLASIGMVSFVLISFIAGTIAGSILIVITFGTAVLAYRYGWDLDNIQAPLITAFGDFVTIPSLLLAAYVVLAITEYVIFLFIIIIAITIMNIFLVFSKETKYDMIFLKEGSCRNIVLQSSIILALCAILDTFAGILVEFNIESIVSIPIIFVLLPAFLEEGGNIGNVLSSRLASKLHLGTLDPTLRIDNETKKEFLNSYILTFFIFLIMSVLIWFSGYIFGVSGMTLFQIIEVVMISAFILITIVLFVSFAVSILSYKYGLDPDNVTLPLVASGVDLLGVICLLTVLHSFGIIQAFGLV